MKKKKLPMLREVKSDQGKTVEELGPHVTLILGPEECEILLFCMRTGVGPLIGQEGLHINTISAAGNLLRVVGEAAINMRRAKGFDPTPPPSAPSQQAA